VKRPLTAAAALLAATVLLACGGGNAHTPDAATIALLRRDMNTLATAAESKNYSAAGTALTTLRAETAAARAAGELSDAQLARIVSAANIVQADLTAATAPRAAVPEATSTTPTPTLAPTPTPSPKPGKSKHKGGDGGDGGGGG
jgi:hypothetical protein